MDKFISTPTISEILKEEFMEPLGLSAYRLAKDIHVPVSRVQEILNAHGLFLQIHLCVLQNILAFQKVIFYVCRWMLIYERQNLVQVWKKR